MIKLILFIIIFILVFKLLQFILRYLNSPKNKTKDTFERSRQTKSKYKDVEEAEFKEIKTDENKNKSSE